MSITKPYYRNYRSVKDGPNSGYSDWAYIIDKEYAIFPAHYVRAYKLIQSDLELLFEYIEPSDEALKIYSYRIHELLMRTCIEIEANFKAILSENIYTPQNDRFGNPIYNMGVYKKINTTHHLSGYEVVLPIWNEVGRVFKPFEEWGTSNSLPWYRAYNASKHDRKEEFKQANFENLLNAVTGLLVLLTSQFRDMSFSGGIGLSTGYDYHDLDSTIGGLFRIKYPDDWTDDEKYDFDWSQLEKQTNRFQKIDYNTI
ncbi:hypothetical protein SAMN05660461_3531 [Chitinophaga ginsengisegetis]|uniref:Uncharacterized protein n=1 Tax=Chitinophaga ginsengisegetis TaxID=393003 RepID=A0A1T5P259_9BACT|nr:hypothetical protein [Chitinophaga ginsengisegetis]SKD06717.1 hypothetical protein SAMN05660461_3531 [Chitinophaga ginsengisegetis]